MITQRTELAGHEFCVQELLAKQMLAALLGVQVSGPSSQAPGDCRWTAV